MKRRLILGVAAIALTAGYAMAAPTGAIREGMPLPPPAPAAPPAVAEPLMGPPPPMLGMPAGITGPKLEFPEGDMFFYVENDGRHVVALDGEGKLKWRRDPWRTPVAHHLADHAGL